MRGRWNDVITSMTPMLWFLWGTQFCQRHAIVEGYFTFVPLPAPSSLIQSPRKTTGESNAKCFWNPRNQVILADYGTLPLVANSSLKRHIEDLATICGTLLCQTLLYNFPSAGSHFKFCSNDSTVSVVSCSDAAKTWVRTTLYVDKININCYGDFAGKRGYL